MIFSAQKVNLIFLAKNDESSPNAQKKPTSLIWLIIWMADGAKRGGWGGGKVGVKLPRLKMMLFVYRWIKRYYLRPRLSGTLMPSRFFHHNCNSIYEIKCFTKLAHLRALLTQNKMKFFTFSYNVWDDVKFVHSPVLYMGEKHQLSNQ